MNTPDNTQPPPRRRRWPRIFLKLFLAAVVAALLFEAWAAWALGRARTEAVAGGQPLTFPQIEAARTVWPPETNGGLILLGLKAPLEELCGGDLYQRLPWLGCSRPPRPLGQRWSDSERVDAEEFLRSASAELQQIDRLRNCPGGRLPFDTRMSLLLFGDYEMAFVRMAMKIKSLQILDRAMAGHTESLEDDLAVLLNLNRVLAEEPTLIGSLVRIAGDASAVSVIEQVCAVTTPGLEALEALDYLLADVETDRRLYWGLLGERALFLTARDAIASTSCGRSIEASLPPVHGWLVMDQAMGLRVLNRLVEAADHDADRARQLARDAQNQADRLPRICVLSRILIPSLLRPFELNARLAAQIRAARAALAAERFRLARGELPGSLESLVPEYLEKVPSDPFDGRPLRSRSGDDRLVIYSIDDDLTDDGGDVGPKTDPNDRPKDHGFVLLAPARRNLPAPATAPATATAAAATQTACR